jgi:hypothetical protein
MPTLTILRRRNRRKIVPVIGKALILAAFDAATDGRPGAGGYNPPFPGH